MNNKDDYKNAYDAFLKAIELNPNDVSAYNKLGLAHQAHQEYAKAIAQYQKAVEIQPDCVDGYNNWGLAHHAKKEYDEAIVKFQKAIEIQPDYVDGYSNWGLALYTQKEYAKAIVQFQKVVEIQPDYADGYNNWGNALYDWKKYDEAIVQFQKAIEIQPDYVAGYINWGNVLYDQRKYDEAIAQYQKAVEIQPGYVDGYNNWGLAHYAKKEYAKAIVQFQKVVEIQPDYADGYNNWGNALCDQKKYDEAMVQYQKAMQVDQDYVYARHNVADTLQKQGKYQEARAEWINTCQVYEKTIQKELEDSNVDIFYHYGSILHEVFGALEKAESIYRKGFALDADHLDILLGLVKLYLELQDENIKERTSAYWNARECYRKADNILRIKISNQRNALDLFKLGELLLKMEEYDEAEKYFLDTITEDNEFTVAYANLGVLYTCPEKEDIRKAAQYLEKAHRLDYDDLIVWSNLAEAYLKLNLKEKAETEYKKILRRAGDLVDAQIGLGEVYMALAEDKDEDQYKQAIDQFTKSIKLVNSKTSSRRLRKQKIASVYYSRGYASVKLYEHKKTVGDNSLLVGALADFKQCFLLDQDHHKSERAIEKIKEVLGKARYHSWLSERIGPWLIVILSVSVFVFGQISLWRGEPLKNIQGDTTSYLIVTFFPLVFLVVGLYLPSIFKLKFAGVEIEKSTEQQITMSGSLGIRK